MSSTGGVTEQIIIDGTDAGHHTYAAIETILKGPEVSLDGRVYLDKGGDERQHARRRWWDPDATTLRSAAMIPGDTKNLDGQPFAPLPDDPLCDGFRTYADVVPVIVGHYWETGERRVYGTKVACVDYSAGKGGPLVAYRWDGEPNLLNDHFVSF